MSACEERKDTDETCCLHDLGDADEHAPGRVCCWCGDVYAPHSDGPEHGTYKPHNIGDTETAVDATLDLASENQRLRERVAELERTLERVALCLSTPNTAIVDTIWLDESARSTPTLFEFICCALGRDIAPPSQPRRDIEAELDAALAQVAVLRGALKMTRDRLTTRGQVFDFAEFREKHALHFIDETLASTPAPTHDYSGLCAAPSCEGHCGYVHARGCEAVREYLADHGGEPYRAPSKDWRQP